MARSIESRRALLRAERGSEFGNKSRVKRAVREERSVAAGARHPVDSDQIPIHVLDEGPYIHYPASSADVANVLCLLPAGLLDGLQSIRFCLGERDQPPIDVDDGPTPDPLVGRVGYEELPGVYAGQTLALYRCYRGRTRISVHAYVYDRTLVECRIWEVALRAEMLGSLAHELAHHEDRTQRYARGRWFMVRRSVSERYAQSMERTWADRYVLPYIRDVYPDDVAELRRWFLDQPTRRLMRTLHPPKSCSLCRIIFALARDRRTIG